jgi:multiple sugar transport system permease protein
VVLKLAWVSSNPGHLGGFRTEWMKERLDTIKFLDVTTSMLPNGIPFPVLPEAPEIMNIIVPDMMQNVLTGQHDRRRGRQQTRRPRWRRSSAAALAPPRTQHGPAATAPPACPPSRPTGDPMQDASRPAAMRGRYMDETDRSPGLGHRIWDHRADYLYVLPALIAMLVVIAYPIYYTIELSFFRTPPSLQLDDKIFVGLDNYTTILTSRSFWDVTWNTMVWTFFSTLFAFLLGLGAALALHREFAGPRDPARHPPRPVGGERGGGLLRLEVALPFGLRRHRRACRCSLASPTGPSTSSTYVRRRCLADRGEHLEGVLLRHDHADGGAQTVPDQLLRAARVDGASAWQRFWHVTMPHLRGVTTVTILLAHGAELQFVHHPVDHDRAAGPAGSSDIWITQIYQLAFGRQRWGVASAYSVLLFIFMMVLGYFYVRALTKGDDRRAGG